MQKTPLRVLHRRSLLNRPKCIYRIETVLLNDHFFLMNLRTSAGTQGEGKGREAALVTSPCIQWPDFSAPVPLSLLSAGTYVKEFVHGDLGRTSPSVCSLLGCQADILQLDVVWLFDDFEGGGEPPEPAEAPAEPAGPAGPVARLVTGVAVDGEAWRPLPIGALRALPLASGKDKDRGAP